MAKNKKPKGLVHPPDRMRAMKRLITFGRDLDDLAHVLPASIRKLLHVTSSAVLAAGLIKLGVPDWAAGGAVAAQGAPSLADLIKSFRR